MPSSIVKKGKRQKCHHPCRRSTRCWKKPPRGLDHRLVAGSRTSTCTLPSGQTSARKRPPAGRVSGSGLRHAVLRSATGKHSLSKGGVLSSSSIPAPLFLSTFSQSYGRTRTSTSYCHDHRSTLILCHGTLALRRPPFTVIGLQQLLVERISTLAVFFPFSCASTCSSSLRVANSSFSQKHAAFCFDQV